MKLNLKSIAISLRSPALIVILLALITTAAQAKLLTTDSIRYSGFGYMHLYKPTQAISNVIICVSGDGGWNESIESIALKLNHPIHY